MLEQEHDQLYELHQVVEGSITKNLKPYLKTDVTSLDNLEIENISAAIIDRLKNLFLSHDGSYRKDMHERTKPIWIQNIFHIVTDEVSEVKPNFLQRWVYANTRDGYLHNLEINSFSAERSIPLFIKAINEISKDMYNLASTKNP